MPNAHDGRPAPRVGLFVTCLVDAMRPRIGFAAIRLLEEAGCVVEVPEAQTCCGQPAFNSGDTKAAPPASRGRSSRPSSRSTMSWSLRLLRRHDRACTIPRRWPTTPPGPPRAGALAAKTFEITELPRRRPRLPPDGPARSPPRATYHDSCAGLRELGVFAQPRALLAAVAGLEMRQLEGNDVCCGFGGTFCVKYPAISNAIVDEKAAAIERTGADAAARRRPRLPDEHGRQAQPARLAGPLLPHHRGAGRHGRRRRRSARRR